MNKAPMQTLVRLRYDGFRYSDAEPIYEYAPQDLEHDSGEYELRSFATRYLAELFVAMIPVMQRWPADDDDKEIGRVTSARILPTTVGSN